MTPPGINGEHQQNSVKFFNHLLGMLHPGRCRGPLPRAKVLTERTSGPRAPSPIVEIAARSAASFALHLRLIRPPSRESLVFFAEEAATAEAGASRVVVGDFIGLGVAGGAWRDAPSRRPAARSGLARSPKIGTGCPLLLSASTLPHNEAAESTLFKAL